MNDPNPYQSPTSSVSPLDGVYTWNLTALRNGELWRLMSRWDRFVFTAIAKTLRLSRRSNGAFRPLEPFSVLPEENLPAMAREKLCPALQSCRELGFQLAFYCAGDLCDPSESCEAFCLNDSGTIAAELTWIRTRVQQAMVDGVVWSLGSWLDDGTDLTTWNQRAWYDFPPFIQCLQLPDATPAELLRRHSGRLQTVAPNCVMRLDRHRLLDVINADKRRFAEFQIARGVWVPKPG